MKLNIYGPYIFRHTFVLLLLFYNLTVGAWASYITHQVPLGDKPAHPPSYHSCPGIVDELRALVGPRFADIIMENPGQLLECASTIVVELPCYQKAMETANIFLLMSCGLSDARICNCTKTLPKELSTIVDKILCDNLYIYDPENPGNVYEKPFPISNGLLGKNLEILQSNDVCTKGFLHTFTADELSYVEKEKTTPPGLNGSLVMCGEVLCAGHCPFGICSGYKIPS